VFAKSKVIRFLLNIVNVLIPVTLSFGWLRNGRFEVANYLMVLHALSPSEPKEN
jgi:hypothetical protein